jgi:hypothetical protein
MDDFQIKIENSEEVLRDNTAPTVSEQTILTEIQDISNKISTKKTFNLNSLGNYAQILKTLEENRNKFVEGQSIDLKPLQSFAVSAEQLTGYMNSLIGRFNGLANINNATIMKDIHENIDKINTFVNTSEMLFKMMDNPQQFEWFNKYNDTVMSIKNSMNAYEKIAKQITYQLSDPVNYVNPQIKGLTELFNQNYMNNPLPQNFFVQNQNNPPPALQSLPSLDAKQPSEQTVKAPIVASEAISDSVPKEKVTPRQHMNSETNLTNKSFMSIMFNGKIIMIIFLITIIIGLILYIIFRK